MAAAAAYRVEEEQLWKCPKHPSKRRRHGVCPTCLRDRLVTLCPNCGNARPCPCNHLSPTSSAAAAAGEPSFARSRSLAIPFFLRSNPDRLHSASFLSVFRRSKTKKGGGEAESRDESNDRIDDFAKMVSRSRSVGVGTAGDVASGIRRDDVSSPSGKGKFWNLKAFRSFKTPKAGNLQDQSSFNKG